MIYAFDKTRPDTKGALFIASTAAVIGDVILGDRTSVWFQAVIRGDIAPIRVAGGSNVQDCAVLHVDEETPLSIGDTVTVGHGAIVHGCTVESEVLIGMGSRILNGAVIRKHTIVGAGAVVPPGKEYPARSLLIGAPARRVREITDEELEHIRINAEHYIENARRYAASLEPLRSLGQSGSSSSADA